MTSDEQLAEQFIRIRAEFCRLEQLIGDHDGDVKEFDKAVCVMKVGAKVMKRELTRRGFTQLGKQAKARVI